MTWIWHMCLTNMKKRGVRTFLTILGVIIGVISIVSMIGLGIGVKKQLMKELESMGSITEVTVIGATEGKRKDKMLTDRKIRELGGMDYVAGIYPTLTLTDGFEYEKYFGYTELVAVPQSYLEKMELSDGEQPAENALKPELLVGGEALNFFFNDTTGVSYVKANKDDKDKLNLTGKSIKLYINQEEEMTEHRLNVSGTTKKGSYQIYCNLDVMKKYLKRISRGNPIPGQPLKEDGEAYNDWIYSNAIIEVDKTEHVEKVIENLQDMGFQTENSKEALESMQKQLKMIQLLLAGIGMIALLVAVIGIGNTMTTAVYDRINEIGILKVLGCDPDELKTLFLLESAILGGIGGVTGIGISYGLIYLIINKLAIGYLKLEKGTQLAIIPPWLALAAIAFAVVLGVIAGYFPARWAAKLKPIKAVTMK